MNYHLAGRGGGLAAYTVKKGKIVDTFYAPTQDGLEPFEGVETSAQRTRWRTFDKTLGRKFVNTRRNSMLKDGNEVLRLRKALKPLVGDSDACAIATWLGGAYHGDKFLDVHNLVPRSSWCNPPVNVGDALERLRDRAPKVFGWVRSNGFAKALNKTAHLEEQYAQDQAKVVKVITDTAEDVGEGAVAVVKSAGKGLKQVANVGAFGLGNIVPVLIVGGIAYLGIKFYVAKKMLG
jgi:hypothetical protein